MKLSINLAISCCGLLNAVLIAPPVEAADLRIGMRADPDVLDPAQGGSVAGRVIFAAMCDKLIDSTPEGDFTPQLATGWEWSPDQLALTITLREGVKFHDGTPLDAGGVKRNLERYRTDPASRRQAELKSIDTIEVIDPLTVKIQLSEPYAPLIAVLADRSGMMMSPATLSGTAEEIGANPVCAGPFKFVERVAQDHIRLERFEDYWNADEVLIDEVTYYPIPDDAVRFLNLRSGDLDIIERISPSDAASMSEDMGVKLIQGPSLAYDLISINIDHTENSQNPLGENAKVRQALEMAIDRAALNQVVYGGLFIPNNQTEVPGSEYYVPEAATGKRDVEGATALLAEAGVPNPSFTLTVANNPTAQQIGQMIQVMAAEAGIDIEIQALESSSLAASSDAGDYEATMAIWSGRLDPDSNISPWAACDGFLNWGRYCNADLDAILAKARQVTDSSEREQLYADAVDIIAEDTPYIVLYHYKTLLAARNEVDGLNAYPDSLIRLQGVNIAE